MRRATDSFITFHVKNDFDFGILANVQVIFKSTIFKSTLENLILMKELVKDEVEIDNYEKTIKVHLTYEETKLFPSGNVQIQIKAKTDNDVYMASKIFTQKMEEILDDKEI